MASDYSYVYSPPPPCKSRSAEIYERQESKMGVLVTGPWPMSQPSRHPNESRNYEKNPCVSLRNSPSGSLHSCSNSNSSSGLAGRKLNRPLSMPPQNSYALVAPNSYCSEPEHPRSRLPPSIPSRISLTLDRVPTSPPTCVPWLKKMKVMKKIRRKIGMGQSLSFFSYKVRFFKSQTEVQPS